MPIPVGGLGELLEAASAWKRLFFGVRSKMVLHGGLFRKAVLAHVAD